MFYQVRLTNVTLTDPLSVLTFVAHSQSFSELSKLHHATNMCTLFHEYNTSGAMQAGALAPVKELIKSRLNIVHDIEDKHPLETIAYHTAIINGELETVKENTMSVNMALPMGALPIHTALFFGQYEVAQWLALHGASLTASDARGTNTHHIALYSYLNGEKSVENMLNPSAIELLPECQTGDAIEQYGCVMQHLMDGH